MDRAGRCGVSITFANLSPDEAKEELIFISEATPNKGMNRTRNERVFHREVESSGGLCAPVIPGVMLLLFQWIQKL